MPMHFTVLLSMVVLTFGGCVGANIKESATTRLLDEDGEQPFRQDTGENSTTQLHDDEPEEQATEPRLFEEPMTTIRLDDNDQPQSTTEGHLQSTTNVAAPISEVANAGGSQIMPWVGPCPWQVRLGTREDPTTPLHHDEPAQGQDTGPEAGSSRATGGRQIMPWVGPYPWQVRLGTREDPTILLHHDEPAQGQDTGPGTVAESGSSQATATNAGGSHITPYEIPDFCKLILDMLLCPTVDAQNMHWMGKYRFFIENLIPIVEWYRKDLDKHQEGMSQADIDRENMLLREQRRSRSPPYFGEDLNCYPDPEDPGNKWIFSEHSAEFMAYYDTQTQMTNTQCRICNQQHRKRLPPQWD